MSKFKNIIIGETHVVGSTKTVTKWMGGFGHWLKDTRKSKGLSVRQLSVVSGIPHQTLYNYEQGQLPTMKNYIKLQRGLGNEIANVSFVPRPTKGKK